MSEVSDVRLVTALAAVLSVTHFRRRTVACEISMPYLNATIEDVGGYYRLGVTRMLVRRFNNVELRAVIGHEIAHVVLGDRVVGFKMRHRRTAHDEENADAMAARWFGKAAMRAVLKKVRTDAQKLPQPLLKRQAVFELDARINALQRFQAARHSIDF